MEQDQKLVPSSPSAFLYIVFSFSLVTSLFLPYSTLHMLSIILRPGFSGDGYGFLAIVPTAFSIIFGSVLIAIFKRELKHTSSKIARWIFDVLVIAVVSAVLLSAYGTVGEPIPSQEIYIAPIKTSSVDFTSSIKTEIINPWIKGRATFVNNSDGNVIWNESPGTIQLSLTLGVPAWIKLDGVTDKSFDIIKFDYKLISEVGSGGVLYVYVDKELVFVVSIRDDNDVHTSGYLKISPEFLPSTHSLRFTYTDNLGNRNYSKIEIFNIVVGTST